MDSKLLSTVTLSHGQLSPFPSLLMLMVDASDWSLQWLEGRDWPWLNREA